MNRSPRPSQVTAASDLSVGRPAAKAPDAFTDRVMAAIVVASPPTPTRSFLMAIRARAAGSAAAALWVAWHLATVRDWRMAPQVRARSLALVLAVASLLATGSLAAAAAVNVVAPRLIATAPAAEPARSPADAPPPTVLDPGTGVGRSRTKDTIPSPIVHLVPITSAPFSTPAVDRTKGAAGDGKHPPAANRDGGDGAGDDVADDGAAGTHAGDDRSDHHDQTSTTHHGGDDGTDQAHNPSQGDGGSNRVGQPVGDGQEGPGG